MTAAAGVLTGLAKLKRQDSARSQQRPAPPASPGLGNAQEAAPRKRKRRADVVVVRGRLRLYSASGFFLLLGLIILAIGIGMATLGYWPHGESPPSARAPPGEGAAAAAGAEVTDGRRRTAVRDSDAVNTSTSHDVHGAPSKQTAGALTRFLEQHRHSERMKMLGPFTMGIGIFIFICANAILHENRDRETKIIHMRDMYSTVIDIHRLRQREQKQQLHRRDELRSPSADGVVRTPSGSLLSFSSWAAATAGSGGSGLGGPAEEEEGLLLGEEEQRRRRRQRGEPARPDCSLAGLLAPLYKERAGLGGPCGDGGRQQWAAEGEGERGGHHARSIVSSSISAFTLPVIKLNNCVIDEPETEAITEEEGPGGQRGVEGERSRPLSPMESLAVPVASVAKATKPPGLQRSNSASSSSSSPSSRCSSRSPSPASGCWLSPGAARGVGGDFGSSWWLHMLGSHSKSLDLERGPSALGASSERRKHPSWPRLDRSNSGNGANRGSSKGYTRLEDRDDQPGERRQLDAASEARRDYSKREKLLMISRSHNNLSFEHDDFNSSSMKRGSSETRF